MSTVPTAPADKAPSATDNSDLEGQMRDRRRIVHELRAKGHNPFANDVRPSHQIFELPASRAEDVASLPLETELPADAPRYAVAGRLLQVNEMGKAKFLFIRGDEVSFLDISSNGSVVDGRQIHGTEAKLGSPSVIELGGARLVFLFVPRRLADGLP